MVINITKKCLKVNSAEVAEFKKNISGLMNAIKPEWNRKGDEHLLFIRNSIGEEIERFFSSNSFKVKVYQKYTIALEAVALVKGSSIAQHVDCDVLVEQCERFLFNEMSKVGLA